MCEVFVLATTSVQKKETILFKTNFCHQIVRNKFLGQKLKTTDSFQRMSEKVHRQ